MATHALIIGKSKDGQYHYGQTHWDGDENTVWLQKHMSDVDKVEEFLHYMTEGCAEGGEGHGISCLTYERSQAEVDKEGPADYLFLGRYEYEYDFTKPKVEWYIDGFNCGIAKTKKAILEMVRDRFFEFPEYISYWDGKKWKNVTKSQIPRKKRTHCQLSKRRNKNTK